MVIKDVQVKGGYIVHMGSIEGTIRIGDQLNLLVDTVSALNGTAVTSSFIWLNFIALHDFIIQKLFAESVSCL